MKASNKEMENRKKDMDRYLTCPRCGARVAYYQRLRHSCFRAHLKEMEMDIARMAWGSRAG
jgi:transcription elongation factor Elf1